MKFSSEKALDKRKSIGYNYVRSIKIWSLYGGIAQLARAFGSYPKCRWFKSICRYQWPDGQEVKTPPFHGGITRSILVRVTMENKVIPRLFGGSFLFLGRIAQLVRAFASHARGRGFESPCVHQICGQQFAAAVFLF